MSLNRLSLRLRIFLFFGLLAMGGTALAGSALYFGWTRADNPAPVAPFVTAFIVFAFLNTGLALWIWLLFDEHVAKPINRLSANLRLKAHSKVATDLNEDDGRYLGDLAPAAKALSRTVDDVVVDIAANVARETARLRTESERFRAVLSEIPIATILLNPAREIMLYDAQAAGVLGQIAPPRLKASFADYFDDAALNDAIDHLSINGAEAPFELRNTKQNKTFPARLKALGDDGHMVLVDVAGEQIDSFGPRPLVFDFDLMDGSSANVIGDMALADLCLVAFDTETTGLSVDTDAIVQLAAVRVLKGRIVEGETLDSFVDPGRPIPAASTRIHKVTDADVAGAPSITEVSQAFHHFAQGAVLVAHNAPFDFGLLNRSAGDAGVAWDHPILDTVLLSAVVFGTTEDHSLDALCARLAIDIPAEQRHTALGDARATAEAVVRLLPLLEGKGFRTFGDLIAETQRHGRLLRDMNVAPTKSH